MYIKVISLHSEAFMCRERESVCVLGREEVAAIVLDLVLLGAALLAAVAGLQELAGADLGVVLCKFDKGFKGPWITY
jgi:hypothetical protein